MKAKKEVAEQIRDRYQKASKKEKTDILNEFIQTTGYANRKYAIWKLCKKKVREVSLIADGKTIKLKTEKQRPKNRQGKKIYTDEVICCLRKIWAFYWHKCGKYLAPMIREQMPYLETHKKPDFRITAEIKREAVKHKPSPD